MVKVKLSWDDITKAIDHNIKHLDTKPDLIIPIARGGLIPGAIYSHKLDIPDTYSVTIKSYEGVNQNKPVFVNQPDLHYLQNKNLLIVDDISDTGNTFIFLKDFFNKAGITNYTFHTLYIKNDTKIMPKSYYKSFGRENWLVFPWENNK